MPNKKPSPRAGKDVSHPSPKSHDRHTMGRVEDAAETTSQQCLILQNYSKSSFKYEVHLGDVPSWHRESKWYQFMIFCLPPTTLSVAVLEKKFRTYSYDSHLEK